MPHIVVHWFSTYCFLTFPESILLLVSPVNVLKEGQDNWKIVMCLWQSKYSNMRSTYCYNFFNNNCTFKLHAHAIFFDIILGISEVVLWIVWLWCLSEHWLQTFVSPKLCFISCWNVWGTKNVICMNNECVQRSSPNLTTIRYKWSSVTKR